MKSRFLLVLFISIVFVTNAQSPYYEQIPSTWEGRHHMLCPSELELKNTYTRNFPATPPPEGGARNFAEWEPNQGVVVRGSVQGGNVFFGIPYHLIASLSEHVIVYIICANQSQSSAITTVLQNNGVNMENVEYVYGPTDSYWTRDYTPWFIEYGEENNIGLINFPYNRPRPNDDNIPIVLGQHFNKEVFGMELEHTGGNFMSDGYGVGASCDLVEEENPQLSVEEIDQLVYDYLGITNYYLTDDPLGEYIQHIDTWGKFLAPDKIVITSVPASDNRYHDFEAMADFWANQTSSYGNKYKVFRTYSPNGQPYTNSLIMNERVYVPIVSGAGAQFNQAALDVYAEAMPGYEIIAVPNTTGTPWQGTDALHCRTYQVPDFEMLRINHMPYVDTVAYYPVYNFEAEIYSLGSASIVNESVKIHYKINNGDFQSQTMNHVSGKIYSIDIDEFQLNDVIKYFIQASDSNEKTENHPYIGIHDPHEFVIVCGFVDLGSDLELCGGSVVLDAGEGFAEYYWNGTAGQQTLEVITSGTYIIEAVSTMGCSVFDTISVSIYPDAPETFDAESCGESQLTLSATGEGILNWYENPVGGNIIHTGSDLTEVFSNNTTFYVESVIEHPFIFNVGNTASTTAGGNHTNNSYYLEFDAYSDFTLISVEVNASTSGNRIIELRNSQSQIIENTVVSVPQGVSRVELNFDIEPGTGYQLRCGTSNPNLWRSNSGVNYPYTVPDVVSITGTNVGQNWYYYFYDWEIEVVQECVSARKPVNAIIHPEFDVDLGGNVEQCGGTVELNAGSGFVSYTWDGTEGSQYYQVSETGTYHVVVEDINGCTAEDEIVVIIHPEVSVEIQTSPETAPGVEDGTATAIITGGTEPFNYLWNTGAEQQIIEDLPGGVYSVTVTDQNNCTAANSGMVNTLDSAPIADFSANNTHGCDELIVNFIDNSLNYPDNWFWDFGDGTTSTQQNPQHIYDNPGAYNVSLNVSNVFGENEIIKTDYIMLGETPEFELFINHASGEEIADGEAWVVISAGVPPYYIHWSTGQIGEEVYDLLPGIYSVFVKDLYNCITTKPFVIDWITSIEEETVLYGIYPNPATDRLFIDSYIEIPEKIEIINTTGNVVITEIPQSDKSEIDISRIAAGLYFVRVFAGNDIFNFKLIIK